MANMIRLEHGFYTEVSNIKSVTASNQDKESGNWYVGIEFHGSRCYTCLRLPRTIHQIDELAARINKAKRGNGHG